MPDVNLTFAKMNQNVAQIEDEMRDLHLKRSVRTNFTLASAAIYRAQMELLHSREWPGTTWQGESHSPREGNVFKI